MHALLSKILAEFPNMAMLSELCGQFPVTAFTQGLPNLLEQETFQSISKSFFKYIRMYMENNLRKNPKISAAFRIHKVSATVQRGKLSFVALKAFADTFIIHLF